MSLGNFNRRPAPRPISRGVLLMMLSLGLGGCAEPENPRAGFEGATHVIAPASGYFLAVPQEGQLPDGQFGAGTKVKIVEEGEQYTKVQDASGTEAYVPAKSVRKQGAEG